MVEECALETELDVEAVSEMVSGCLPEFSDIDKEAVSEWLFDIENKLRELNKENNDSVDNLSLNCISLPALIPPEAHTARVHRHSETSDPGNDSSDEYFTDVSRLRFCSSI